MPRLDINVKGTGGAYAEVFRRCHHHVNVPDDIPIRAETLDGGMISGQPSIAFIIEVPEQSAVVVAQTSVRLFQLAAAATYGKYGDQTGGALEVQMESARTAALTTHRHAPCPSCHRDVPKIGPFCCQCGAPLS